MTGRLMASQCAASLRNATARDCLCFSHLSVFCKRCSGDGAAGIDPVSVKQCGAQVIGIAQIDTRFLINDQIDDVFAASVWLSGGVIIRKKSDAACEDKPVGGERDQFCRGALDLQ